MLVSNRRISYWHEWGMEIAGKRDVKDRPDLASFMFPFMTQKAVELAVMELPNPEGSVTEHEEVIGYPTMKGEQAAMMAQ